MEREHIELHDERKEKMRNQSGRYAYVIGLAMICISIMIFSVLGTIGLIADTRLIIIYLGGFLVFQYITGVAIFRYLSRKG